MIHMIFEGEQLGDLLAALEPEWKARTRAERVLMETCSHAKTKGNAK
ncbi:hypothetical protein MNBD_GAMMA06-750 [hydrothermal vent metagenome]|uniref:Uncharacterized protein n=1 Tax=hydrothermal vent metagenome TaxID=652676 RepID=A0A3B0WJ49_9ZZZZ